MTDAVHVAGVAGSMHDESRTRAALEHALRAAAGAGAEVELLDLRAYDLPVFDPDEPTPESAARFTRQVRGADAVVLATPMYHGSYSGALKNAIDYCGFDEFDHTTVGLLAVGGGAFPVPALEHLRSVCRALNAWVLPHQAAVPNASAAIDLDAGPEQGPFDDDDLGERVATLGREVVEYAHIEPDPPTVAAQENVGAGE